ncbi:MAG TPA: glutathione S-transferase N-terminal domain-containing protein [Solimonas sp.]|nr:glutathione S-transferase N-terminal domain-containing protein [Solimonas sp.]
MQKLTLVIADKSRSSWSLRPWLFLRHHGVEFEEVRIALGRPDTREHILEHSPSGKLPCLHHGALRVWESLAICEYAAETFALPLAWPLEPAARAMARAMAAEMHAGFAELRHELPFDTLRPPMPQAYGEKAAVDIARIRALWREARQLHGQGGWLFGKFGIVDAMFAPVALRFHQYQVPLDGIEREYMFQMLMHPAVQAWMDGAATEELPVREGPLERTAEIEPPVRAMVVETVTRPSVEAPMAVSAAETAPAPVQMAEVAAKTVEIKPVEVKPVEAAPVKAKSVEVTAADLSATIGSRSAIPGLAPQRYVDDPSESAESTAKFSRTETSVPVPAPAPAEPKPKPEGPKPDAGLKSIIMPP